MRKYFFLSLLTAVLLFNSCEITVSFPDYVPENPNVPINTTRQFWAQDIRNGSFYSLSAQKLVDGEYCTVWGETGNNRATLTAARSMANAYDTDIYPKMKAVFSIDNLTYGGYKFKDTMDFADSYGDEDGKLCILLLDIRDGSTSASSGYVGGYFYMGDFFENASMPNSSYKSNERDMIYVDTYPSTPGSPESNTTLAHEMQHLMDFVHDVAIRGSLTSGVLTDTWLTEGLSAAAEWVYTGTPDTSRLNWYNMATTANGSRIITGNNFYAWDQYGDDSNLDDYATVSLFFQWLRLQTGGSANIYSAISRSSHFNYNAIVSSMNGYSDWPTLLKTWLAANYINAPSGPYGYMNDDTLKNVKARTAPSGTRSVNLYPGEGVYSVTNTGFNMPSNNGNIRYAGLNRNSPAVNDTAIFASGALLTYNVDTNLESRPQAGTTTGVAASVEAYPESLSVRAALSGPFAIGARDMLRRNGYEEAIPPFLRFKLKDKYIGDSEN